jgi:hypothetical protein
MNILNPPRERIAYYREHLKVPETVWDPITAFDARRVKNNCARLEASFERLQTDSNFMRKFRRQSWFLGVSVAIVTSILSFLFNSFIIAFYGLAFIGLSVFTSIIYLRSLSKDLIKLGIAKKENWIYDPDADITRAQKFIVKFPEIFKKGSRGHEVEDQFWGTYKGVEFHSGLYRYVISSGKNSRRIQTHYYAIKMKSPLKARFHLYPENIGSKIGNVFTKKEISTESIAFNNAFAFSYDGKKEDKALDIVATLTPAVQQQLVDLKRNKRLREILFTKECIIFLFSGVLLQNLETNLAKSYEISARDIAKVDEELHSVLNVSEALVDLLS